MSDVQMSPQPSPESEPLAGFSIDTFNEVLYKMDPKGYCCINTSDDEMVEEAVPCTSTTDTTSHCPDDKENQHIPPPNRHLHLVGYTPLIMNQLYSKINPNSRVSDVSRTTHWVNETPKQRGVKRKLDYTDKAESKRRRLTALQDAPISCNNSNKFKVLPDQDDDDEQATCVSVKTDDAGSAKGAYREYHTALILRKTDVFNNRGNNLCLAASLCKLLDKDNSTDHVIHERALEIHKALNLPLDKMISFSDVVCFENHLKGIN
ncbi:uncharacterized protein LOC134909855 isoform X2 [Pseudophryne corroboree]|uniref:uncharacterized protein LOC134909855 isoform X2 n=1 Tax=Pseudophryne corroboree TaxID=495146 RepID=UPI0030814EB5